MTRRMTLLPPRAIKHVFAAASLLLLGSACGIDKSPPANAPAHTEASGSITEADYVAAKDAYVKTFAADEKRGTPYSVSGPRENAALRDLADRLRKILGPFQGEGFAGPGTSNITTLYPEMDVDNLDGIVYESSDSLTVLVTTRTLLAAWLRDSIVPSNGLVPHDPMTALTQSEVYALAFPEDAMVVRFADIPVDRAAESGIIAAMLVRRTQDFGPSTPNDVMVSVLRGNRLYFAEQPARVLIAPTPACDTMWHDAAQKQDSVVEAGRSNATDTAARDRSWHIAEQMGDQRDSLFLRCYAEHVSADPRFAELAQQVASIVRRLPQ